MGEALNALFSPVPGFRGELSGFGWMVSTDEQVVDFNCSVIDENPEASSQLDRFFAAYKQRSAPFMICLTDSVSPQVREQARALGLREGRPVPMMALQPDRLEPVDPPNGLSVERVTTLESLRATADLTSTVFGIPGSSIAQVYCSELLDQPIAAVYLARVWGQPASAVALSLHEHCVGIWSMGTLPTFRRQGVGKALLGQAMSEHWRPGVTYFLISSPMGRPLYESMGFEQVGIGQGWLGP